MNTAGFWQGRFISLPQNDDAMNRLPLDEVYLLYSLSGFFELKQEEQRRISVTKLEYSSKPDFFTANMKFEYENAFGLKTKLTYELAGKRSEDHFFEHVMYEHYNEEIEFSNFRDAIDYCNNKQNH